MTMTIEKIEFPRRETKQGKSKKSLTIDSDDEPVVSVGEIDPGIQQMEDDKSLEPEQSQVVDKSSEKEEPQKYDKSSASLEATGAIKETIVSIQTAFENHLMEDGKGSATIASYTGDIKGFTQWVAEKKMPFEGKLTRFAITSYRKYLLDSNYSVNTINKKINSLHSFNHFLISQGLCHEKVVHPQKDKVKVAHGSEAEVIVFSEDEVERLLFFLENKEHNTRGRFYCVALNK